MADKDDFWTLNGQTTFGTMPGIVVGSEAPIPICLQRGIDTKWGADHIWKRHGHFAQRHAVGAPLGHEVPWLVWKKLQQSGAIYTAEEAGKLKVSLPIHPNALLVMRLNYAPQMYFSITTLYTREGGLDGTKVGRYAGVKWLSRTPPTFDLPP